MRKHFLAMLLAGALLTGCGSSGGPTVNFTHLHGLGYDAATGELVAPAHDGLRAYDGQGWRVVEGPAHDYMGFAMVEGGFYSSGHPAPGDTSMPNPIGLIKSTDLGQSLTTLGFQGESDFHLLGAGYKSHAIYLFEPYGNAQLQPGLHYTLDEGKSWTQIPEPAPGAWYAQIAVHPTDSKQMAFGTGIGLFVTRDAGKTYKKIGDSPISAVAFTADGNRLLFGLTELYTLELSSMQATPLPSSPKLQVEDGFGFIAPHPTDANTFAVGAHKVDIFHTADGGKSWTQIVKQGEGRGKK